MVCFRGKCKLNRVVQLSRLRPPLHLTSKCFVHVQPVQQYLSEIMVKIVVTDEFDNVLDLGVETLDADDFVTSGVFGYATSISIPEIGIIMAHKYSYFPDVVALCPPEVYTCPIRFSMEEVAMFGTKELGDLLTSLRQMERSTFAALFHGPRTPLGFADLDVLAESGKKLAKIRFLTNAYGLTPIRRRLVEYMIPPSASCREMMRLF